VINSVLAPIRYFRDIEAFLRHTLTLEEAREIVERQFEARVDYFVYTMRHAVFARPSSPYCRLLRHAGIEMGDIERMARDIGLEGLLEHLHDAGVYVTPEEFKGRAPVRRPGLEFQVDAAEFDNPLVSNGGLREQSGGSTGEPVSIGVPLQRVEYRAAESLLVERMEAGDRPTAAWKEITVKSYLQYAKVGSTPEKLFATVGVRRNAEGLRYLVYLNATLLALRLNGRRLPRPQLVLADDAIKVATWLAAKREEGKPALLVCRPASAVRTCVAAEENGLDISGTLFQMGGEPFTPAKAAVLARAGARASVRYAVSETSLAGFSCGEPDDIDDVHLMEPKIAAIQREHVTPAGESVQALLFTSLLPSNPKILLNWYSGDYATMSSRACGCPLGAMGLTTHLSGIRSYEKLTGEGVTFRGSRLYMLLEEILPSRFGGQINDYQLVEEEAEAGLTKLSVYVSPRVGAIDEGAILACVMDELEASHARAGGGLMTTVWRRADTLRVLRREPIEVGGGKIPPFRPLPRSVEAAGVLAGTAP
jgi:hypothetical protein